MADVEWLSGPEMAAWRALLGVSVRLLDVLDHALQRDHGLSGLDYGLLVALDEHPDGLRPGALAAIVGDSSSCLAHRVRRLETAGAVVRSPAPDDRRGRVVQITGAGRERLRRAAPDHVRLVREHFTGLLTTPELERLSESLGTVAEHLAAGPYPEVRR